MPAIYLPVLISFGIIIVTLILALSDTLRMLIVLVFSRVATWIFTKLGIYRLYMNIKNGWGRGHFIGK